MLLETVKSFVIRSRKRKGSDPQQTLPNPDGSLKLADSAQVTPSNASRTGANSGKRSALTPLQPYAEQPTSTLSFLPFAHDFVINNSTMIANIINSGETILQVLSQKRIPGAEVDSSARDPPPKCHPETRKSLRSRVVDWVTSPDRHWRMLWIIGPMGVGKSAIAQTIAEEFNNSGRLGASLFFSRPNHRDDPDGVIPSLAYQLADRYPEYKRIITQRLADSVSVLEKARRTQFKELIIEPFRILMAQNSHIVKEPLLIILDGLDECRSKEAQCEFIELISDHVRQVDKFPLLWMICSRPEWHLKGMLSHPDFQITCQREEISIDDIEAQEDVARVLQAGFQVIRRKYYDRLDPTWPPETDVRRISTTASGHFAFASTIIKFIGDEYCADPCSQLNICIRFLGGFGMPGAMNPLHALDLLYRQILSDVPSEVRPTAMRILGLSILYPDPPISAYVCANFLSLDQAAFYRSLQHLHSVLEVPAAAVAHHNSLHFYHASFADYLIDSFRSGSFSINTPAVHHDVAIHSIIWQKRAPHVGNMGQDVHPTPRSGFRWIHPEVDADRVTSDLRNYSLIVGWKACSQVSDEYISNVMAELENFDFGDIENQPQGFGDFLAWLYQLGSRNNSLICLRSGTANPPIQNDTRSLSIRHLTDDLMSYISFFGATFTSPWAPHFKIPLQLGAFDKARNIDLTVLQNNSWDYGQYPSPPTPPGAPVPWEMPWGTGAATGPRTPEHKAFPRETGWQESPMGIGSLSDWGGESKLGWGKVTPGARWNSDGWSDWDAEYEA